MFLLDFLDFSKRTGYMIIALHCSLFIANITFFLQNPLRLSLLFAFLGFLYTFCNTTPLFYKKI